MKNLVIINSDTKKYVDHTILSQDSLAEVSSTLFKVPYPLDSVDQYNLTFSVHKVNYRLLVCPESLSIVSLKSPSIVIIKGDEAIVLDGNEPDILKLANFIGTNVGMLKKLSSDVHVLRLMESICDVYNVKYFII